MGVQDAVSQSDTAWRSIFDPANPTLYVRLGRESTDIRIIRLDGFSFREGTPVLAAKVDRIGEDAWLNWEPRMDRDLLRRVFSTLTEIGETVPAASRQLLLDRD